MENIEDTKDADDKKFASEAVAFVIKNSEDGIVPLCASVANLLKEKDRMAKKILCLEALIEKLQYNNFTPSVTSETDSTSSLKDEQVLCEKNPNLSDSKSFRHETSNVRHARRALTNICKAPIMGCLCEFCCKKDSDVPKLQPPLKLGEQVVIVGELCGTVKYIGHADFSEEMHVFVGLHLDAPIGNTNGSVKDKTYFVCPDKYGLFVDICDILCILK